MNHTMKAPHAYYLYSGASSLILATVYTINMLYFIETAKLSPLQMVLVGTAMECSCFFFEIPTGVVADMFSRKISILIGLVLMGFGFALQGIFPNFWVILLSQLIWGLGFTFGSGADTAWIADEVEKEPLEKVFMRGTQFRFVGSFAGIFLSAFLAKTFSYSLPNIVGGILFVLLSLFLFFFMPEKNFRPQARGDRNNMAVAYDTFKSGLVQVKASSVLILIVAISAFEGLYSEGLDRLWTFHLAKDIGFPNSQFDAVTWLSAMSAVTMLLSIGAVEVAQRVLKNSAKSKIVWLLLVLNAIQFLAMISFSLLGNFYLAVAAYCCLTMMRNTIQPLISFWNNENITDSTVRATVLSTKSQVNALGQMAGGPLVGMIAKQFSVTVALLTSTALLVPIMIILGMVGMKSARRSFEVS